MQILPADSHSDDTLHAERHLLSETDRTLRQMIKWWESRTVQGVKARRHLHCASMPFVSDLSLFPDTISHAHLVLKVLKHAMRCT
jgi:hypothetical protein